MLLKGPNLYERYLDNSYPDWKKKIVIEVRDNSCKEKAINKIYSKRLEFKIKN